jgi:hypothetical protein
MGDNEGDTPMTSMVTVADYISRQIDVCGKNEAEIADEVGYPTSMVSMIRTGRAKLPIGKIGFFAKALAVDPAILLQLVMMEYSPDTWRAINEIQGRSPISANEQAIVNEIRKLSKNSDPKLQSAAQHKALKEFVDSMVK